MEIKFIYTNLFNTKEWGREIICDDTVQFPTYF